MTDKYKSKAAQEKKDQIAKFKKLIEKYDVIAAVNMVNLSAKQVQNMRTQLRGNVEILMAKRRLMKIAIKDEIAKKKGIDQLISHLKGMPALLFTNENPFKLYKILQKNKSSAPIKAGQIANKDIIVPAGPTGFAPGPIIGELGSCKIKAGIDAGKVVIKEDSLVAKEGTEVNSKLAAVLLRLGIEPLEIGLDLTAAYEEGELLTKDVLSIDETKFKQDLIGFAKDSFNLAIFIAYSTKETINCLLSKAIRETRGLAKQAKIVNKETIIDILAEVNLIAKNVHSKLPEDVRSKHN